MIRKINSSLKIPKQIIEVGVQLCPKESGVEKGTAECGVNRDDKWRCSRAAPFRKLNVERHRTCAVAKKISLMLRWLYTRAKVQN